MESGRAEREGVRAVDIDQAFIDHIAMRARERNVANVKPILGDVSDAALPAPDVDVALFHDVLHHIREGVGRSNVGEVR